MDYFKNKFSVQVRDLEVAARCVETLANQGLICRKPFCWLDIMPNCIRNIFSLTSII